MVKGLTDEGRSNCPAISQNNAAIRLNRKEQLCNAGYSKGIEYSRYYGKYKY